MGQEKFSNAMAVALATDALFEEIDSVVRVLSQRADIDKYTRIFEAKRDKASRIVARAWEQARQGKRVELAPCVELVSQLTLNIEQDNDIRYMRGDGERFYLDMYWDSLIHVESIDDVVSILLV